MAQPTRHSSVHRELSKRRYRQRTVEAKHRDPHRDRRDQKRKLQARIAPDVPTPEGPSPESPSHPEAPDHD